MIHAWGKPTKLDLFIAQIQQHKPPLARIDKIEHEPIDATLVAPTSFEIITSKKGEILTGVTADAATCPACLTEVLDPDNRRYRYPFTNCTHCGPRLSIIKAIPYDRAHTSMATFKMCARCQAEYDNPKDRRFHAQPNACRDCGPQIWLEDCDGNRQVPDKNHDEIQLAARLIRRGQIIAIKGIGGMHLCCDASNTEAVTQLRQRKHRFHKALALMARNIEMVKRFAKVGPQEAKLLQQRSAPIVLLTAQGESLTNELAPGQITLGFMLPYTPLHHLLMQELTEPVVMTSGNLSKEPQVIDNQAARERLTEIADYLLLHDREIVNRLDDSVQRVVNNQALFLRRARGYAPQPILLPQDFYPSASILAMGGELKNTFCLLKSGKATLSQYIGDLENTATFTDYRHNLSLYQHLFDHQPKAIVVDSHPDYLSTQLGRTMAEAQNVPLIEVQHHHAHITTCMAEHGLAPHQKKVLGIALDGLGMGTDGSLWGGEFLQVDYHQFERLARFQPVPMLGGAQAIYEPWRNTFAQLHSTIGWQQICANYADLEIIQYLNNKPLTTLTTMAEKGLNSPMTSSCGRLFDAVAAAIGICREHAHYEGQAAIELESLATSELAAEMENAYPYAFIEGEKGILNWYPLWEALLDDIHKGIASAKIASRFHHGLARAVVQTTSVLCANNQMDTVVLSGGVFQNKLLLEAVSNNLLDQGLQVFYPTQLSTNDSGLALGQAVIGAACITNEYA